MNAGARRVQRVYLLLLLLHTLAASFIWGINTLFLLDAGLTNTQAFAANAFFTAGLVLFEVPTGVLADLRGRRLSYLIGTLTLALSTLLYLLMWRISAPFWAWALASVLLGLGFTFFSGAVQAWLVDALRAQGYDGALDPVFARGEIVEGGAMLGGSVLGGYLAQMTNLGVPYVLRAAALALSFVTALLLMHDIGFTPKRDGGAVRQAKAVLQRRDPVRIRQPAGALGDDRERVHRWRGDLRVLCDAAIPARLVRRSEGVWQSPGCQRRLSVARRLPAACSSRASRAPFRGVRRCCRRQWWRAVRPSC